MALIPYWQELKGDEPEFSKKASRISGFLIVSTHLKISSIKVRFMFYCRRSFNLSWVVSHICANDEHRFQVRATNRPENIVIRRTFIISKVANLQHFHFSQLI
jgi:hypothetical protein